MTDETERDETDREIADLLPFYATGAIDAGRKVRVGAALASDPALRHELDVIEEERWTTTEVNESLGAPSRQARERFLALLDAEPARSKAAWRDPAGWLAARLESLRPRTLAWAGVAAVLVVAAQAGVIGLMTPRAGFETASVAPKGVGPGEGALLIVAFAPDAKAGDIARLLDGVKGTIVGGPRAGAFFQVRVGGRALNAAERQKILATLESRSDLVRFAAPGDEAE